MHSKTCDRCQNTAAFRCPDETGAAVEWLCHEHFMVALAERAAQASA
jgi:hypothetical protein